MGIFDTFYDRSNNLAVQLKTNARQEHYDLGDHVPYLYDGMYIAPEGIVVIKDQKFVAAYRHAQTYTKYGECIAGRMNYLSKHYNQDVFTASVKSLKEFGNE